jgi:hypothetical protein
VTIFMGRSSSRYPPDSRSQKHAPESLALQNVAMRLRRFRERKYAIDQNLQLAVGDGVD